MPLIDHTYFIGELNIPNTDKPEVFEELMHFIAVYEEKFFNEVFGYSFYKAFKTGISAEDVDQQRWIDLLLGTEYGNSYWKGLLQNASITSGSSLNGYDYKPPQLIRVGVTTDANGNVIIAADSVSVTKSDWIGWDVIIEKIGFGTMKVNIDYNYDKGLGKVDLTDNVFVQDEFYFVEFQLNKTTSGPSVSSTLKKSMIANYVYYWYMRNGVSTTTGTGEAKNKTENAFAVSSADKMIRAWNEMVEQVWELSGYLNYSALMYTDWNPSMILRNVYRKINAFGI